jgi:hypothetical protein
MSCGRHGLSGIARATPGGKQHPDSRRRLRAGLVCHSRLRRIVGPEALPRNDGSAAIDRWDRRPLRSRP